MTEKRNEEFLHAYCPRCQHTIAFTGSDPKDVFGLICPTCGELRAVQFCAPFACADIQGFWFIPHVGRNGEKP